MCSRGSKSHPDLESMDMSRSTFYGHRPSFSRTIKEGRGRRKEFVRGNDALGAHAGPNMPGSLVLPLAPNSETSHERRVSQEKVPPTPLRHDGRACRGISGGRAFRDVLLENQLLIDHWDFCRG